jgi:hypothetical protein
MTDEYETEFKLLEGYECQLQRTIKSHVAKGWQPRGREFQKGAHSYQAVVRYKKPEGN